MAREVSDVRPLPLVRKPEGVAPNPDGYIQFARNMVIGMSKNFRRRCTASMDGRAVAEGEVRRRDGRVEIFKALMLTPEARRCAMRSSASAPPARSPTCSGDTPQRAIARSGVIGAGTMAAASR